MNQRRSPVRPDIWDVVIVGAGPAGLSAALVLGRCCRKVLLCDKGTPRSWASHAMHGYASRDGIPPTEFRKLALAEISRYSSVTVRDEAVVSAQRTPRNDFAVLLASGAEARARKLLLATGLMDELPPIPDIEQFFGTSVFPCPYCDGWELRQAPIAVYGHGKRAFEMARSMTAWTRDIVVCTDGPTGLSRTEQTALTSNDIRVEPARIVRLEGPDGKLERIVFDGERAVSRSAMFFNLPTHPQSELARSLGCEITSAGGIRCGKYEGTTVPGVFVAGNILRDVQLSIVAAAEGAKSAFGINRSLTREDFSMRAGSSPSVDHPGP